MKKTFYEILKEYQSKPSTTYTLNFGNTVIDRWTKNEIENGIRKEYFGFCPDVEIEETELLPGCVLTHITCTFYRKNSRWSR